MKRLGFTISELLTAILIISIVMAASVPIMTMKKNRIEKEKVPHGIFECYYDAAGNLHQYRADNQDFKTSKDEIISGTSCTFDIPIANYYKIQAIGAGTDGLDQDFPENIDDDNVTYVTGSKHTINVGEFSTDTHIPSYVEEIWNDLGIKLKLEMTSTRGYSGATYCKMSTKEFYNNNGVQEKCGLICNTPTECPEDCKSAVEKLGGNSGKSIYLEKEHLLGYKATVIAKGDKHHTDGTISFYYKDGDNEYTYVLTPSGTGSNAYPDEIGQDGEDSKCTYNDGYCDGYILFSSSTEAPDCISNWDVTNLESGVLKDEDLSSGDNEQYFYREAAKGKVCYFPKTIIVDKLRPKFSIEIGMDGSNGIISDFIYPNLPGTTLTVTPAKSQSEQTKISSGNKDIIKVNSSKVAEDKISVEYEYLDLLTSDDNKDFYYTSNEYDLPNLSIDNINDTKYRSMIDDLSPSPGTKGKGFYTLLDSVKYEPTFSYQPSGEAEKKIKKDPVTIVLQDTECKNGADKTADGVCRATKGQPGAVRIVW